MLNLLLVEAALETVPKPLWSHPSVINRAMKLGRNPRETFLDRTYHHRAMLTLEKNEKRGRPDIVHFALLEALGTPLNREGLLRIYVHTIDNNIISIAPEVRLPRNHDRFVGVIRQLYKRNKVPEIGQPLLKLRKGSLEHIISSIKPSYTVAFTRKGELKTLEGAMKILFNERNPAVIIGAFPKGQFSANTVKLTDSMISIDPEMLEAWTVTSRVIYEFERLIGLPRRRWRRGLDSGIYGTTSN